MSWDQIDPFGVYDHSRKSQWQSTTNTDTEKEALCARIDELCQENERLRQQNAKLDELLPENGRWFSFDVVRSLNDERDQLAAENAQLRELASILCFCMQVHARCDDCKLNGAKGELAHDPLCACDGLHEILRELRIEAPDGKV